MSGGLETLRQAIITHHTKDPHSSYHGLLHGRSALLGGRARQSYRPQSGGGRRGRATWSTTIRRANPGPKSSASPVHAPRILHGERSGECKRACGSMVDTTKRISEGHPFGTQTCHTAFHTTQTTHPLTIGSLRNAAKVIAANVVVHRNGGRRAGQEGARRETSQQSTRLAARRRRRNVPELGKMGEWDWRRL